MRTPFLTDLQVNDRKAAVWAHPADIEAAGMVAVDNPRFTITESRRQRHAEVGLQVETRALLLNAQEREGGGGGGHQERSVRQCIHPPPTTVPLTRFVKNNADHADHAIR